MPDPVSSYLAATETARLRAENRILAAEVVRARDRARLMALIAQRANDALEVPVRHMPTHERRVEPEDPQSLILARDRDLTPSGCAYCGLARHSHFGRWTSPVGWHTYTPPSQEQIKARMLARRAARTPDSTTAPAGCTPAGADTTTEQEA